MSVLTLLCGDGAGGLQWASVSQSGTLSQTAVSMEDPADSVIAVSGYAGGAFSVRLMSDGAGEHLYLDHIPFVGATATTVWSTVLPVGTAFVSTVASASSVTYDAGASTDTNVCMLLVSLDDSTHIWVYADATGVIDSGSGAGSLYGVATYSPSSSGGIVYSGGAPKLLVRKGLGDGGYGMFIVSGVFTETGGISVTQVPGETWWIGNTVFTAYPEDGAHYAFDTSGGDVYAVSQSSGTVSVDPELTDPEVLDGQFIADVMIGWDKVTQVTDTSIITPIETYAFPSHLLPSLPYVYWFGDNSVSPTFFTDYKLTYEKP